MDDVSSTSTSLMIDTDSQESDLFAVVFRILAQLDCLVSFATASVNGNYIRPELSNEKQKIHLVDSRHPCVEKQDNINFISNTVELDRNKHRFQIITGRVTSEYFVAMPMFTRRSKHGRKVNLHSSSMETS